MCMYTTNVFQFDGEVNCQLELCYYVNMDDNIYVI